MPTDLEDLASIRTAAIAELKAIMTGTPKKSYSIDGVSVDWNGYREHLLAVIRATGEVLGVANGGGVGAFVVSAVR